MSREHARIHNRLLDALPPGDRALLASDLQALALEPGETLFEPGEDVLIAYFPGPGTIVSLVLNLPEGVAAETAMIGQEGAAGGIVSSGRKPAFARGTVEIGGPALRLSTDALEQAKRRSATLRDHFARFADCLLAQVQQSVVCNAVHHFDARLASWLLRVQDRVGGRELHLTQDFISQMLGVQRTYATRVAGELEKTGAIERRRGIIIIKDRHKLKRQACDCYAHFRQHFERMLPGVYPSAAQR